MMTIEEIFHGVEHKVLQDIGRVELGEMEYDSRKIEKNGVFIALEGLHADGHNYIDKAIALGARLVVISKEVKLREEVAYVLVEDLRQHLGILASNYYEYPQNKLKIVGVTGTNGKTTSTFILEKILGEDTIARIGTVEYKIGSKVMPAPNTTPESLDLVKICREAVDKNIEYLIMEVSSHALELGRVAMVDFDVAMFTNLSIDHLDFHKTVEEYFRAKRKLFLKLKDRTKGVYNIEDNYGIELYNEFDGIGYGEDSGELRGKIIEHTSNTQTIEVDYKDIKRQITTRLLGRFNMMNILGCIGVGLHLGLSLDEIARKIQTLEGVPGRFEIVDRGQNFSVVVDYAHTGDALINILNTLREIRKNRIITIFGCGGERGIDKRFDMGKVAKELGDYTILTADNPRSEDIKSIMDDIETSFTREDGSKERDVYEIIEDRSLAIKRAVDMAEKDDIILIAGKGHETYQILKDRTIDLDDRVEARRWIEERLKKRSK